jgi:hypothetical protein
MCDVEFRGGVALSLRVSLLPMFLRGNAAYRKAFPQSSVEMPFLFNKSTYLNIKQAILYLWLIPLFKARLNALSGFHGSHFAI